MSKDKEIREFVSSGNDEHTMSVPLDFGRRLRLVARWATLEPISEKVND